MKRQGVYFWILFFAAFLVVLGIAIVFFGRKPPVLPANVLSVRQFGALGDGRTNDTAAFQRTLDWAAGHGRPVVEVPAGDYIIGSIVLLSHVALDLEAGATLQGSDIASDYPLTTARWEGVEVPAHQALISASNASDIAITGSGTIKSGARVGSLRQPRGPVLVEFVSCQHVRIEGALTLKNNHIWTVHPVYCQDVAISGITVSTWGSTSDGLDPDSCQDVRIDHCTFATGDDCISIKSGRGLAGQKVNRPCEDVTISDCHFEQGIGAVALGSEVSGGVRHILIRNCVFDKGLAAVYVKTNESRGGFIEDVTAEDLQTRIPLCAFDTSYNHRPSPNDIPGSAGLTPLRNFSFARVTVDSNEWYRSLLAYFWPKMRPHPFVDVAGDPQIPIDGVSFDDIAGYADNGFVIQNVNNLRMNQVRVKCGFSPMLSLSHVQMAEGASAATPQHP